MSPDDTGVLDARYGRRPPRDRRRLLAASLVAFVVVALAWAVWAGLAQTRSSITWRDVAVDTADPAVVKVAFEVTRGSAGDVVCSVRATDAGGAVVGWVDVAVPSAAKGTAAATADVRTVRPAGGGGVVACVRR